MSSNEKQRTLGSAFSLKGKGLHSGVASEISVKPAPVGTGIAFRRSDIPDSPWIQANFETVKESVATGRQTSLGPSEASVATIEHLMAVFSGMGVDNAYVEVSGPEIPGLDGSGEEYCRAIETVGLKEQDSNREYFEVKDPIYLEFKDASLVMLPSPDFKVSYTLSYGNADLEDQFFSQTVSESLFRKEIASARTFVLRKEVEALQSAGYGKGADLTNTLVYEKNQPLNNRLRFKNEAARHKALDLIGDLYLLGCRLKGHVIASRTGHQHNLKLVAALKERLTGGAAVQENKDHLTLKELEITHIKKLLPHRYPFLFVDRVTILEEAKRAVGIKNVTVNDYFFQGHFPGRPVMPGVLIVEAMAQTAGVGLMRCPENYGKLAFFMSIDGIKFRHPVVPGDQLRMEVNITRRKAKMAEAEGKAYVGDKLVCEAILRVVII